MKGLSLIFGVLGWGFLIATGVLIVLGSMAALVCLVAAMVFLACQHAAIFSLAVEVERAALAVQEELAKLNRER